MTIPSTQTAWIYKEYGSKELLSTAEVPVAKPESDEVLVKVHAAALNPVDYKRLAGLVNAIGNDNLPTVPGYDVAGVVVAVGSEVTKFKVGDKVYGDLSEIALKPRQYGSFAQYAAVEEKLLAVIPQRLSFLEAASLPAVIETAYEGFEAANLKEGQTVLVLGGAGGVGTLAVQVAKVVFKASLVAATTSTTKVDFVKSLGADVVIDYKKENLEDHPTKYDVVFDTVGQNEGVKAVKEDGKVIVIAGAGPVQPPAFFFGVTSKGEVLETLNPLLEDGTIKPIIDKKGLFKFNELVQAFGYIEGGRATGKVVISVVD